MTKNIEEQEKRQNDIDNVEKIIKKNGFMAVKENKVLEELYTKIKNSDLKELISNKENIKKYFFRGRLFNKDEKDNKIKEEGNKDNNFLSFVQPPLKMKLSSARFNHINNSYFYISDNKYAPYFEMEKYKKENKGKELFIQKYKLKEGKLNLLDTSKIDNFLTKKLGISANCYENRIKHVLSDNYNVSNFFMDLFKSSEKTSFNGILYDNKKMFDIFTKEKNYPLGDVKVENEIIFYKNITFFSNYWNYNNIKFEEFFTKKNNHIIDDNIIKSTDKTKKHCIEANKYFKAIGQPEKISVEKVMSEFFRKIVLRKYISKYSNNLFLEVIINLDFKKLIKLKKIKVNNFLKLTLNYPKLEYEEIDKKSLKFEIKINSNKYIVKFIRKENDIVFTNETETKKTLLNYIKELFNYFFGIYYKLEFNIDKNEISLINQ